MWYEWLTECPAVVTVVTTPSTQCQTQQPGRKTQDWLSTCWNLKQVNSQTGFLTTNTDEQDFTYFNIQMEVNSSRSLSAAMKFIFMQLFSSTCSRSRPANILRAETMKRPNVDDQCNMWGPPHSPNRQFECHKQWQPGWAGTITVQIGQLHQCSHLNATITQLISILILTRRYRDINAHVSTLSTLSDQALQFHISIART